MNAIVINNPTMPYWGNIPGNLFPGRVINVKGVFPLTMDTSSYGAVSLCEGTKDLIALHISIRFNHREVIRNTKKRGQWESEEKGGPFPFEFGSEFWIQIIVQPDAYHISVNGQQCWTYRHRMPFLNVNTANVEGPFQIFQVEFTDQNNMYQPAIGQPATFLETIHNPPVPFTQIIPGGIKPGMMFYISATPSPNFQKFTINFQCGCSPYPPPDIAFHFDVRPHQAKVVRNTRRDNQWGQEEVVAPNFPFQSGVPFDMIILIQSDKYMVAINGQHFIEYHHQLTRFILINALTIEHDINIASVRFCS